MTITREAFDQLPPEARAAYTTIREPQGFFREVASGLCRWSLQVHPHRPQDFRTFNGGAPFPIAAFPSELADFQRRFATAMARTDWPASEPGRTLPEQCWQTEAFKCVAAFLSGSGFTVTRAEIPAAYRDAFAAFLLHERPGLLSGG